MTPDPRNEASSPAGIVDRSLHGLAPDPMYGAGALPVERRLAFWSGVCGSVLVVGYMALAEPDRWNIWLYLIAATLAFDLIGGVVANGLNSAKRDHFAMRSTSGKLLEKIVRSPVLFSALHLQPIIIGLLYPGPGWWWGFLWYTFTLTGVISVGRAPLYLQRPVALLMCTAAALMTPVIPSPAGLWWVPVVLALKLILAHAVQEEPYRPLKGRP